MPVSSDGEIIATVINVEWATGTITRTSTTIRQRFLMAHGSVLVFVWAFLTFVGVGAARYFRHHRLWFIAHRGCQTVASLITAPLGIMAVVANIGRNYQSVHARIGVVISLLSFVQGVMGVRFSHTHFKNITFFGQFTILKIGKVNGHFREINAKLRPVPHLSIACVCCSWQPTTSSRS
jgi:hypothetical protein